MQKELNTIFKEIMDDQLTSDFNLDGRLGKRKLLNLALFDSVLYGKPLLKVYNTKDCRVDNSMKMASIKVSVVSFRKKSYIDIFY